MSKGLIFLVEDEEHVQQLVKYNLEANGFNVTVFGSAESLLPELEYSGPDLFILDIMLPGMDGFEVCRKIRENPKLRSIPIIILTAKSDEFDKVLGLELGADDYITKPFSIRELVARVKSQFRRLNDVPTLVETEVLRFGDLKIDFARREVYKGSQLIEMPLKEFELLTLLLSNKGKVLSRDILLEKIWSLDYTGETRTVDVHIRYLRQKIEDDDSNPKYIETVRGIGYKFNDTFPG